MTDRRQVLQAAVLAAAGVVVLPACSSDTTIPETPPEPDAQQADELALIAAYDEAIANGGDRAQTFSVIREEHAAHLRALGWQFPASPASTASPEPMGRAALVRAERGAARQRADAARDTDDAERAQILALIAASEAQHVVTLEAL